jgi:uncharacterized protein YjbJ (UPF0337 family)
MDRAAAEARWKQLRGRVKETWADLTDDDLDRLAASRSQFVGQVQERYGMSREAVERKLEEIDRQA